MLFRKYISNKTEYPLSVCYKKEEELKSKGIEPIFLAIGDPTEPTFSAVRKRLISELENLEAVRLPVAKGEKEFLQAASFWAKRNYNHLYDENSEILSCNGTKEAIFHFPFLYEWGEDKEIFIPALAYPVYKASAEILSAKYRLLPLKVENNFLIDLDSLSDEDWKRCGIFWINSPHNPTTSVASREYIEKLLELSKKYNFIICSDECYLELTYNDKATSFLEYPEYDSWIVFRSLSKRSRMTGYRTGLVFSKNKELLAAFSRLRSPAGLATPLFVQRAAIESLNDDAHPRQFMLEYQDKRDLLRVALEQKGFIVYGGEATFYLWFSHPKIKSSKEIFEHFADLGLVIAPGTAFGDGGEGFARISYCIDLNLCKKAAEKIKELKI